MTDDINLNDFINLLDFPIIFLDEKGFVIGTNNYYNSLDHKISFIDQMKCSIFDTLIISSDQKEKLKRGEEVSSDYILNLNSGELSSNFPSKRLVDKLFININFSPVVKNCIIKGYYLIVSDNTQKFNDGIDIRERKLMWKNIAVLGKMAYVQYDVNLDEWSFSEDYNSMFLSADPSESGERTLFKYLEKLSPKDRKMLQEQWGLSLVDSNQGDVFEYSYQIELDGELRYHSARWTLDSSTPNPVIYAVLMDITELTKTEHALSDSIAHLSLLSNLDSIILWNYDVEKGLFHIDREISNDDFIDSIGIKGDSLSKEDFLLKVHLEDIKELKNYYNSVISGNNFSTILKTRIKNQNDSYIFVSTNFIVKKSDIDNSPLVLMGLSKEELDFDAKHTLRGVKMEEKQTILIAEDIDNNYDLLNIILRKDYKLVRAVNGIEAVKLFSEVSPDIILMDMKMPEMGGLEATRLIRMESQDVPIIAVTAFAFESDREVAIEAGCNDFLSKPIDIPVLKSLIKKYLNK